MKIETENILNKRLIISFLIVLTILFSYIIYLNLDIIDLNDDINSKDNIYKLQINNRINEIEQLNTQLADLQNLLNIGLDLSSSNNIYLDTKLSEKDKRYILSSIPSSSPLGKLFITSKYGYRFHPIFKTNKLHTGLDLRANVGTKIYSTADGIVLEVRNQDLGGYGKVVKITHNYGFETLFGHLDDIFVKEGDIIKKGDLIGLSGNTGNSNGQHLHYEITYLRKHINPQDFLYWNTTTFNTILNKKQDSINWGNLIYAIMNNKNIILNKEINVIGTR
ncbi:MAG: M23 family metallopeptidase [Aliarcobacter sp.]|nr:M23 family metallopeptidase [Aliarcobacter sp.]